MPHEPTLFDAVSVLVGGMVPEELGEVRQQPRQWGIKVWFGPATPPHEHYEAQVIGSKDVPEAKVLAIEVGFHAEHPKEADNQAAIEHVLASEKRWRRDLGKEAVAGPFLGRATKWRRVSETWADPDLSDPDIAFEIAARLCDYVTALEPARRLAVR